MSNFPGGFDDDSTLPAVNDNLTEVGGDAINALRDAVFQIEQTLGLNVQGVTPNLAARLGVFINSDGTPNASVLTSLGLVTLPITNSQIAPNAGIPESKLLLDFKTQDLFNFIRNLSLDVNTALGWISVSGVKLEPHLIGAIYRHSMDQIDVSGNSTSEPFLSNVQRLLRNNLNAFTLANDMNNELLAHQWADGSPFGPLFNITTNNGSIYTSYFAHVASGIFLDSSRFSTIPQTRDNVQLFAEFIDTQSIFLLGTRIQNLYTNGISNVSTASTLTSDGYGQFIVPTTPVIAYLENNGNILLPFDNINSGDDIVQFVPSLANQTSFAFDSAFSLVRPGDIIRIHYADGYNIEVPYVIREKKYNPGSGPGTATYAVRIAGKNQAFSPHAIARIDRPLSNPNKFAELAISPVNNLFSGEPSLVINNPRGAQALGNGFDPSELDENHYNLYLAFYPTGFASDGYTFLPAIDVTGNKGTTPGQYTLETVVQATNNAFRTPGFNYRLTAFANQGNFGIALADAFKNPAFSIVSAAVSPSGAIDTLTTGLKFPNNVLDLVPITSTITTGGFTFPVTSIAVATTAEFAASGALTVATTTGNVTVNYTGTTLTSFTGVTGGGTSVVGTGALVTQPLAGGVTIDPLGIGPLGAGIASPPFLFTYGSSAASLQPTKLFIALKRNNYYVNGAEIEKLAIPNDVTRFSTMAEDGYGDGYWVATVQANISPAGRVQKIYRVFQDLSGTNLAIGKTIVVQQAIGGVGTIIDFGRFIIESVSFNCAPSVYTDITVYDAVHANGSTGISGTIAAGSQVFLYFSDDSATFNKENSSDFAVPTPSGDFKRYFEVYIDDNGSNFTQERARLTLAGTTATVNGVPLYGYSQLNKLDMVTVSPKLRGYQFGSVTKITLNITSFFSATGVYTGFLSSFDGTNFTHVGPTTTGKVGEVTKFYDETNTDYIEIQFSPTVSLSDFSNQQIDFQLFPTLQLDTEVMMIGSCQVNTVTQTVSKIVDRRQFGNISEKDLSTSVFDFMSVPEKYLHSNGVIRGFDIPSVGGIFSGGSKGVINISGGVALVNGKFKQLNNETITIPIVKESFGGMTNPINWFLCVNDIGEYALVPQLDFDSNLGTPNAPTRTFTAQDFVSSSTYVIPALTLNDLINRRPDLTVLYQVSSTVSGIPTTPIITITTQDFRKYSFKKDWGIIPTLNADAGGNGDFRNFNALGMWLIRNAAYNNTVRVKGTFTTFPSTLQFPSNGSGVNLGSGTDLFVRLMGDGNAVFDSTTFGTFVAEFIEFNNMTIQNLSTGGMEFLSCNFNSCTINCANIFVITAAGAVVNNTVNNTTFNLSGSAAVVITATVFNGCTFNFTGSNPSITFNDCSFNNCFFNFNSVNNAVAMTGSATILSVMQGCTIGFNAVGNSLNMTLVEATNNVFNWGINGGQPLTLNGNFFAFTNNTLNLLLSSGPNTMVSVSAGAHGVIANNGFVRGAVSLPIVMGVGGYITAGATSIVAVVNNFFDSTTCDGTNQNLIGNLLPAWIYQDNLNTPVTTPTNTTASGNGILPYTVQVTDNVILLTPQAAMNVNLPQISLSPPGRTITIKDVTGTFDTKNVTLHRAVNTETIENIAADYVMSIAYVSLTLVSNGTGWVIV